MGFSEIKVALFMVVVICYGLSFGGQCAQAQTHHVVGDDRGWELASDIASWAATRTFSVGDFLWFAYSGEVQKGNVLELKTKEEFESCDLRNPIKILSDGIDKILLQEEGIRYFASSNTASCQKGLKLPVDVKPKSTIQIEPMIISEKYAALADGPTSPSSSNKIYGPVFVVICGLIGAYVGL